MTRITLAGFLLLWSCANHAQTLSAFQKAKEVIDRHVWIRKTICKNDSCYTPDRRYYYASKYEIDKNAGCLGEFFLESICEIEDAIGHSNKWVQHSCPVMITVYKPVDSTKMEFPIRHRSEESNCSMTLRVSEREIAIEGTCRAVNVYKEVYVPINKIPKEVKAILNRVHH